MSVTIRNTIRTLQRIQDRQEAELAETPAGFLLLLEHEERDRGGPLPSTLAAEREATRRGYERWMLTRDRCLKAVWLRAAGLTFREVGERLGVGLEQARQLHKRGKRILRHSRNADLAEYVSKHGDRL
ncbi:hypothetical protein H8E07_13325 [bacterium]|nr:hypothetical protein [bacterium]